MRLVVIESPYKARYEVELERNLAYARALVEHVTLRGDSPQASHLLITQALDDRDPEHRRLGIQAGLFLLLFADVHLFGVDLGISDGMARAMDGTPGHITVERVSLPEWANAQRIYEERYRNCGIDRPICGSCMSLAFEELLERYQPKWHVHEG